MTPVVEDGRIVDVKIDLTEGYVEQMLRYGRDYAFLPEDRPRTAPVDGPAPPGVSCPHRERERREDDEEGRWQTKRSGTSPTSSPRSASP